MEDADTDPNNNNSKIELLDCWPLLSEEELEELISFIDSNSAPDVIYNNNVPYVLIINSQPKQNPSFTNNDLIDHNGPVQLQFDVDKSDRKLRPALHEIVKDNQPTVFIRYQKTTKPQCWLTGTLDSIPTEFTQNERITKLQNVPHDRQSIILRLTNLGYTNQNQVPPAVVQKTGRSGQSVYII